MGPPYFFLGAAFFFLPPFFFAILSHPLSSQIIPRTRFGGLAIPLEQAPLGILTVHPLGHHPEKLLRHLQGRLHLIQGDGTVGLL